MTARGAEVRVTSSWRSFLAVLLVVVVIGAGLWWLGGSGTGPDRLCSITLYPDRSWKPDGWAVRDWPVRNCNWNVNLSKEDT